MEMPVVRGEKNVNKQLITNSKVDCAFLIGTSTFGKLATGACKVNRGLNFLSVNTNMEFAYKNLPYK